MKTPITITAFVGLVALPTYLQASTGTGNCATGWTREPVQFESSIQYDDMQSKANPTVHVLINGKTAKMMLDTGAQTSVLWDESLINELPSADSQKLYAHVASAEAKRVGATLEDGHGNSLYHQFHLLTYSILADEGYAGILSPQAVAANDAVTIDLEKNCFFTGSPFNIRSRSGFDVYEGVTIPNPYGIMAIPVELDAHKIPLLIDTGASNTSISASFVAAKLKGRTSPRAVDMFGAEIPQDTQMRLVDLKINGQMFRSVSIIPRSTVSEIEGILDGDKEGIVNYGFIGMDILKNRVIYHDGAQHKFILLTPQQATKRIVSERETRTK